MFSKYSGRILMFAMALVFAVLLSTSTYAQAETFSTREIIPFNQTASACNEEVILTGELLVLTHTTFSSNGGIHTKEMVVYRNVTGVGLTTGTQYVAVGGDRQTSNLGADPFSLNFTRTTKFNIISQDGTDNLALTAVSHTTVNPNGDATTIIDNISVRCNGQGE